MKQLGKLKETISKKSCESSGKRVELLGLPVTSSHFEKGRCGGRCRKVCWGVGGGRGDAGRSMRGVGKCVGVWGR